MIRLLAVSVSLLLAMSGAAFAAPSIAPGQYQADADIIFIPFKVVTDGTSISAIGIDVTYNAEAVEIPKATLGQSASAAGKKLTSRVTSPGKMRIAIFGMNNTEMEDGDAAVLTLTRKQSAEGKPLGLGFFATASDKNGKSILLNK